MLHIKLFLYICLEKYTKYFYFHWLKKGPDYVYPYVFKEGDVNYRQAARVDPLVPIPTGLTQAKKATAVLITAPGG